MAYVDMGVGEVSVGRVGCCGGGWGVVRYIAVENILASEICEWLRGGYRVGGPEEGVGVGGRRVRVWLNENGVRFGGAQDVGDGEAAFL